MTGYYKVEGDNLSSSKRDYEWSNTNTSPSQQRPKPTLPSINQLINSPASLSLRDSNDSLRWSMPRTPYTTTPLQSPSSAIFSSSNVNLPSIRNKLQSGFPDLSVGQIQNLPNSQTSCASGISPVPSANRGGRSVFPISGPTTPDQQVSHQLSDDGYYSKPVSETGYSVSIQNDGTRGSEGLPCPPPMPPKSRYEQQPYHKHQQHQYHQHHHEQHQQHQHQHQQQQHMGQMNHHGLVECQPPIMQPSMQPVIQHSMFHGPRQMHHGESQNSNYSLGTIQSLPPTLSGSTGTTSDNGNSNHIYGLGIYPVNQEGVVCNGMVVNTISGNSNVSRDYYDARYSQAQMQSYSRYCGDYQGMLDITSTTYQLQPIITSSKDIKRRTKTGCITCRKRRIKCDERHPTCLNCEKSKRVCIGYDPVFRNQVDKRRKKGASTWTGESGPKIVSHSSTTQNLTPVSDGIGNSFDLSHSNNTTGPTTSDSEESPGSGQRSSSVSYSNTPITIASNTGTPPSFASDQEKDRCRIKIASLLDAADVIECQKKSPVSDGEFISKIVVGKPTTKELDSGPFFEHNPPRWEDVCTYFTEKIAVHLDNLFNTTRFSDIAAGSIKKSGSDLSNRHSSKIGGSEDLAVLETIRQIFAILHPSAYVENLALDENAKLEELRITSNYKLLRCVLQLINSNRDTEFLPVAVEDYEIFLKVTILHQFIYGEVPLKRPANQDGTQSLGSPVSPRTEGEENRDNSSNNSMANKAQSIIKIDENINSEEMWKLLEYIRNGGSIDEQDLEAMAVLCQSNMNNKESTSVVEAALVAILLGLHYSSSTCSTSKSESRIRIRLLELSGTGTLSPFLRRLINMTLSL
ncbi:hypothetical protein AWJ20_4071 [Sugiyamaella lignohabitans]|uniref:Zn(2)-C6 fungal-type domain-containing protein n=1 Tax=Sugiyamaella lignohabitans TaxID=796027 RepID=A0A161HIZ8_9ASCO|nr:uncharacterized protein AWJ20_4071 [Sugiyamaella lignohabitans]ANB11268.1 hypothetical protein AWJ20_4071 [Sugiyamaella lignohabitans]